VQKGFRLHSYIENRSDVLKLLPNDVPKY